MPDREKVMAALKCVAELETALKAECREKGCPYVGMDCERTVAADALDLLKEQEAKPPIINENSYGWKFYYCPSCKKEFYQNHKFRFCEKCG